MALMDPKVERCWDAAEAKPWPSVGLLPWGEAAPRLWGVPCGTGQGHGDMKTRPSTGLGGDVGQDPLCWEDALCAGRSTTRGRMGNGVREMRALVNV